MSNYNQTQENENNERQSWNWQQILTTSGSIFFYLALIFVPISIILSVFVATEWVAAFVLPITNIVASIFLFLIVPIGFFLLISQKTRILGAITLNISSYIIGFSIWLWCLIIAKLMAGIFLTIIGLLLYGIGVVFIAFVSALLHSEWLIAGQIGLAVIVVYFIRSISNYFMFTPEERKFEQDYKEFTDKYNIYFHQLSKYANTVQTLSKNRLLFKDSSKLPYSPDEILPKIPVVRAELDDLWNRSFNHFDKKKEQFLFQLFSPLDSAEIYSDRYVNIELQDKDAVEYFNTFTTISDIPDDKFDEYLNLSEKYRQ